MILNCIVSGLMNADPKSIIDCKACVRGRFCVAAQNNLIRALVQMLQLFGDNLTNELRSSSVPLKAVRLGKGTGRLWTIEYSDRRLHFTM